MGLLRRVSIICLAALAGMVVEGTSSVNAGSDHEPESGSHDVSTPRLAVIALAQQHISVYGANGKMMEARVSTGRKGHDTPAGIYGVLDKEEEHHSNLYDDALMPFMQRLTWSGIAMHAGALPGYPDSHGCARLPYGFASQLYEATKLGMRVVIVREDIIPAIIEQPEMFTPPSERWPLYFPASLDESEVRAHLQAVKEAKRAEADAVKQREQEVRSTAEEKAAEAQSAVAFREKARKSLAHLEAKFHSDDRPATNATSNSEDVRVRIDARIRAARSQLEAAIAQAQAKLSDAKRMEEAIRAVAFRAKTAEEAAEIARRNAWPISIFISRKSQRLYIRRGRAPVFESPITIRNPDKPIGTFVFTALSYTETPGRMKWNVVSMYKDAIEVEPDSDSRPGSRKRLPAQPADITGARNALSRLVIPQGAIDHILTLPLPGASLIISDEELSADTGEDTDFIVFMSGEPQGGATSRIVSATQEDADDGSEKAQRKKGKSDSVFWQSRPDGDRDISLSRESTDLFGFLR